MTTRKTSKVARRSKRAMSPKRAASDQTTTKSRRSAPVARPTNGDSAERRSVLKAEYVRRYREHGGRSGDAISDALRAYLEAGGTIRKLAIANSLWRDRYDELNPGMQAMVISVKVRGMRRRKEEVKWE